MPINMQDQIVADLIDRLSVVADFGELVEEDNVLRIIDSDDGSLPDHLIIIHPAQTEELERAGHGSVRERVTLNITAITRERYATPALRGARLAIKCVLAGTNAGIKIAGVQTAAFNPETPMPAGPGQRWSAHVMPLQITYIQPLK